MQSIKKFIRDERYNVLESSKYNLEKWWKGEEITKQDKWRYYNSRSNLYQLKSICANTDTKESRRWDKKYYASKKTEEELVNDCLFDEEEKNELKKLLKEYRYYLNQEIERYTGLIKDSEENNHLTLMARDIKRYILSKKINTVEDLIKKFDDLFLIIK